MASGSAIAFSSTPSSLANAGNFVETVANVNIIYRKYLEDFITKYSVMRQLYRVRYEGGGEGTQFTISEAFTGAGVAHETGEGENPWEGLISPGYSKTVSVFRRTYSLALTWFFMYHNKYPQAVTDIIKGCAESTQQRMEYDMAAPFTYCTATAYTNIDGRSVDVSSGDGLSLANSAHTLVNSSTTYRNRVANGPQISAGALELGENLAKQQMYDNNGNQIVIVPDLIVLASDTSALNVTKKIIMSRASVDAPNSNVHNPYYGTYRYVVAFAIDRTFTVGGRTFTTDTTKSKQWMLVDTSREGLELIVTQNPTVMAPTVSNGGVQWLNDNSTWKASSVYEPAVVDPRNFIVSTADGNG